MRRTRLESFPLLLFLSILQLTSTTLGIRLDVSLQEKRICRTTVQGRYLISDDNGHVCDAFSLDPQSGCCHGAGEQFSCHGCNFDSQCCNSYEFCVSCCLSPKQTPKELALKVKIAKPATAGTYTSVFDFCTGRCRHNSQSVVHENAYFSDFHHCYSLLPNSSEKSDSRLVDLRLAGINITVGRQGESCDSACNAKGQSCVPNKLNLLNQCDILQKYMSCKGACLASTGADQPAEVADDAPTHLNPGACLYSKAQSKLSCDGSHHLTKRLCPCA